MVNMMYPSTAASMFVCCCLAFYLLEWTGPRPFLVEGHRWQDSAEPLLLDGWLGRVTIVRIAVELSPHGIVMWIVFPSTWIARDPTSIFVRCRGTRSKPYLASPIATQVL